MYTATLEFEVTAQDIENGVRNGWGGNSTLCPLAHAITVAANTDEEWQEKIGHFGSYQARANQHEITLMSGGTGLPIARSGEPVAEFCRFMRQFDMWASHNFIGRWLNPSQRPEPFKGSVTFIHTTMEDFTDPDSDYDCEGCETRNAGAETQEAEYVFQSGEYQEQTACPSCLSWVIYELSPSDLPLTIRRIKNPKGPSTFIEVPQVGYSDKGVING